MNVIVSSDAPFILIRFEIVAETIHGTVLQGSLNQTPLRMAGVRTSHDRRMKAPVSDRFMIWQRRVGNVNGGSTSVSATTEHHE